MATFGERLQELRNNMGNTQKQMATRFSVAERSYARYEQNASTPHYEILIALADYFDVSLDYLVGRSDNPEINK